MEFYNLMGKWKQNLWLGALLGSAVLCAGQSVTVEAKAPDGVFVDFSREAVVWESMVTTVREEADGTGWRRTVAKCAIHADAGVKRMAVLTFNYNAMSQQMEIAYVRVRKPDGTVVATPEYNIQDMPADVTRTAPMYSDVHQKHVAVKGLGVGDRLEYDVTLRTVKPEAPGHFWMEYSFEKSEIVLHEQLDLDVPADKPVTVNSSERQPKITEANGRKLYHWDTAMLARPDPDAPAKPEKFMKPDVQVTTFRSWEEVGAWYRALAAPRAVVSPAIQAKADALTKGLKTPEEKLQAIFNDVALHIHYVSLSFGIGRYQPHDAAETLDNEYGDCKDKHTLLVALLKAAGMEAWPVLIPSSRQLDAATPSPAQFDHVITLVQLNGKQVWMDSTAEVAPVGILFATLRDKQALAMPEAKAAYLERTAAVLPFAQTTEFRVEGALDEKGKLTAKVEHRYHGDVEMLLRAALRQYPQAQYPEVMQRFSEGIGFSGEVKDPQISPVENVAEPLHISYQYTREKFGDWDYGRIYPAITGLGIEVVPGAKIKKPGDDVVLGSPGESVYISKITLPKGWTLVPPTNVDLVEDWLEYHATYSFRDGVYLAERRVVVKKKEMPLADWDKYITFGHAVYDDEQHTSTLNRPGDLAGVIYSKGVKVGDAAEWQERARVFAMSGLPMRGPDHQSFNAEQMQTNQATIFTPLKEALEVVADEKASADDLRQALAKLQTAVQALEKRTQDFPAQDSTELEWNRLLAHAWSLLGWAELRTGDVAGAEPYLRAGWNLSQEPVCGYLLSLELAAKGEKAQAAHLLELTHIAQPNGIMNGFPFYGFDVKAHVDEKYKEWTGRALTATALNHGALKGSLREELDKTHETHPLIPKTTINAEGLFLLVERKGKAAEVVQLEGGKAFDSILPLLRKHDFGKVLPANSEAQLQREIRLVCSQWAGCDSYVLLASKIQTPGQNAPVKIYVDGTEKSPKLVRMVPMH